MTVKKGSLAETLGILLDILNITRKSKNKFYNQRVTWIKHGSVSTLVFTRTSREADMVNRTLSAKVANKRNIEYSIAKYWFRSVICCLVDRSSDGLQFPNVATLLDLCSFFLINQACIEKFVLDPGLPKGVLCNHPCPSVVGPSLIISGTVH